MECEGKILDFAKFLLSLLMSSAQASGFLTNLYACNNKFKIIKSINKKLFLCSLCTKTKYQNNKNVFSLLLSPVAVKWGGGSKLLPPVKKTNGNFNQKLSK